MRVVLAGGHLGGGRARSPATSCGSSSPSAVLARAAACLISAERADEGARQRQAADREIVDRALRLRAPERIGGHLAARPCCRARSGRNSSCRHSAQNAEFARPDDRMRYDVNPSTSRACATHVWVPRRATFRAGCALPGRRSLPRQRPRRCAPLLSEAGLIRERIRIEALWLLHLAAAAPQLPGAQLSPAVRAARALTLAREPGCRRRRRRQGDRSAHQPRREGGRVLRARAAARPRAPRPRPSSWCTSAAPPRTSTT